MNKFLIAIITFLLVVSTFARGPGGQGGPGSQGGPGGQGESGESGESASEGSQPEKPRGPPSTSKMLEMAANTFEETAIENYVICVATCITAETNITEEARLFAFLHMNYLLENEDATADNCDCTTELEAVKAAAPTEETQTEENNVVAESSP